MTLPQSGPDFGQLPLLSETNTASESSQSIGRECRSTPTLPKLAPQLLPTPRANKVGGYSSEGWGPTLAQSAESGLSPVGSLANLIPLQESVRRLLMSVTYGESAPGLQQSFDLNGPCLKTCRDFYQASGAHSSPAFSVTWPRWGIAWDGGYGALTTLGRFTDATGFSSWPTAKEQDSRGGDAKNKQGGIGLATAVKMWPTPTGRDHKDGTSANGRGDILGQAVSPSKESGALNPAWVELLMGFPAGYTDIAEGE